MDRDVDISQHRDSQFGGDYQNLAQSPTSSVGTTIPTPSWTRVPQYPTKNCLHDQQGGSSVSPQQQEVPQADDKGTTGGADSGTNTGAGIRRVTRALELDKDDYELMGKVSLLPQQLTERPEGVILIDMDNTLVDWDAQFSRIMKHFHPGIPLIPQNVRRNYQMEMNFDQQYRDIISGVSSLPDFWASMRPFDGAIKAVHEMVQCNLQVYIVSSPDDLYTARCAKEKLEWIEEMFGPSWKSRVNLCSDKTLFRGDILIDDKPTVSRGFLPPVWSHVLFCHPYNIHESEVVPVICHWSNWKSVILPMLNSRRRNGSIICQ